MAFARKLKQQIKHDVKELLILVNGKKTIFFSSLEIRMNDHIFILMKNIFGMLSLHCKVIWKVPRRFNLKFTNFQHKLEYLSQARRGVFLRSDLQWLLYFFTVVIKYLKWLSKEIFHLFLLFKIQRDNFHSQS